MLGVQQGDVMGSLHLEDETTLSNPINLVGTSTTSVKAVHEETQQGPSVSVSIKESVSDLTLNEVVLSVQENTDLLSETRLPEMGDESLEEQTLEVPEFTCQYNEVRVLGT